MTTIPLNNKVSNLINYIKELSQLKQKPVYSYKNHEKTIWIYAIPEETGCTNAFRKDSDDWLFVKKPNVPPTPKVPVKIQKWVTIDFRNRIFTIKDSIETVSVTNEGEEITEVVSLNDFPIIAREIKHFQKYSWEPYVAEFDRLNPIQELYDELYKIYQSLQNNAETLELVVNVGLLQWKQDNKNYVERHVLSSEVELQFDKKRAEMVIIPSSKGLQFELEEDMLLVEDRLSGDVNREVKSLLARYFEEGNIRDNFSNVLKNIVNALHSRGSYSDSFEIPSHSSSAPIISMSPAFTLRKKSQKSFQHACDTAVAQLETMDDSNIPKILGNMFNLSEQENSSDHSISLNDTFQNGQEYYFPLPSNAEQNKIIEALGNKDSVLVQGPPGTGKTHTIANLTSHLLATGQRILITSQTSKALSVLKDKLPEKLQDLSVSLLGGDAASMKDLEKVVSTISHNKEQFNLDEMSEVVKKNEVELKKYKQKLNEVKTKLFEIREKETYIHNFNSHSGTAKQIAIQLQADSNKYDWYTTQANENAGLSNTYLAKERELVETYLKLQNEFNEAPTNFNQFKYPNLDHFIEIDSLITAINSETELSDEFILLESNEDTFIQEGLANLNSNEVDALSQHLLKFDELAQQILFNTYPKLNNIIEDIFRNRGYIWEQINTDLKQHLETISKYKDGFVSDLVNSSDLPLATLKKMTEDLLLHFSDGGNMGNLLFKPQIVRQYKHTLQKVSYNNLPIKNEDDVKRVHAYAQTMFAYEEIEKLLIPHFIDSKPIASLAVVEYENISSQLTKALEIYQWRSALVKKVPFISADKFSMTQLENLQHNIKLFVIKKQLNESTSQINSVISTFEDIDWDNAHDLYTDLMYAINNREVEEVTYLWEKYKQYQDANLMKYEIHKIETEINKFSPTLLKELKATHSNSIWNQRLTIWSKAQDWRVLKNWLEEFSSRSEDRLADEFNTIERTINETITKIGIDKAWISMLSTMTELQSRHLKAWAQSVKNIGKGTGKNAPRYILEAQKHMEQCKDAVPAWIMPLNRVFENFEIKPNLFDVVIVDEASQSWHDAQLLNYLAKKVIIVGDDKQISPSVVGVKVDDVEKLNTKYLKPLDFEFRDIFNISQFIF